MRLPSENPIRRFSRWLGWSEDQYLSALGYLPFIAAYVAGVVLSYTSLVDLAGWLGFGQVEKPFFPFAIDALVAGCYVTQSRLAGVRGFGWHRIYIVALGGVAVVLTGSGNAMHGLIVWKVVTLPLAAPLLVTGSLVPALAMAGVGHALAICRSAAKARRTAGAADILSANPIASITGKAAIATGREMIAFATQTRDTEAVIAQPLPADGPNGHFPATAEDMQVSAAPVVNTVTRSPNRPEALRRLIARAGRRGAGAASYLTVAIGAIALGHFWAETGALHVAAIGLLAADQLLPIWAIRRRVSVARRAHKEMDIEPDTEVETTTGEVTASEVQPDGMTQDSREAIKTVGARSSKRSAATQRAAARVVKNALAAGREPTVEEVAKATGRSPRQARRLMAQAREAFGSPNGKEGEGRGAPEEEVVIQLQGGRS